MTFMVTLFSSHRLSIDIVETLTGYEQLMLYCSPFQVNHPIDLQKWLRPIDLLCLNCYHLSSHSPTYRIFRRNNAMGSRGKFLFYFYTTGLCDKFIIAQLINITTEPSITCYNGTTSTSARQSQLSTSFFT